MLDAATQAQKFILLRLQGTLMSFNGTKIDNHDNAVKIPTKSLIVGLIGNALGCTREDTAELSYLQSRINYAVRLDAPGVPFFDYQTADLNCREEYSFEKTLDRGEKLVYNLGHSEKERASHLRYCEYVADAAYLVVLSYRETEDGHLPFDRLVEALAEPARAVFLGKKCCLPSAPLFVGVVEGASFEEILEKTPMLTNKVSRSNTVAAWVGVKSYSELKSISAKESFLIFSDHCDYKSRSYGGTRIMKRIELPIENLPALSLPEQDEPQLEQQQLENGELEMKELLITPTVEQENVEAEMLEVSDECVEIITTQGTELNLVKLHVDLDKLIILANFHGHFKKQDTARKPKDESYDLGYLGHRLLASLFDKDVPGTHTVGFIDERTVEICFYHTKSLSELKQLAFKRNKNTRNQISLDAVLWSACTEVFYDFDKLQVGQELDIDLRACVVRRATGDEGRKIERDVYESHIVRLQKLKESGEVSKEELDALKSKSREAVYTDWLVERLAVSGCLEAVSTRVAEMERCFFERKAHKHKRLHSMTKPSAVFKLKVRVLDPKKIKATLLAGVGRHQTFGFGMLKLENLA